MRDSAVCTGAHEHNAPAERWMREIRAALNKKLDMKRDGWWEELQEVQEALNTIKLKTTHEFVESQVAKAVVGQTIY